MEGFKQDIAALRLVPTGGGAFEVSVNGSQVFSKIAEGRFPALDEILAGIRSVRK